MTMLPSGEEGEQTLAFWHRAVREALASGLIDRFGRRDDAWFGVDHDDG